MSKLTLMFCGESFDIEKPKSLSSLRNEISQLFGLDTQDADEMILTYEKNGEKKNISSDEDLKTFLNSKLTNINLDISQNSKIYKDNLNKLKEQNLKDKKALGNLLKKKQELRNLKETKFNPLKEELKEIESKLFKLFQRKNDIQKIIFEGKKQIEKEEMEINKKIEEIHKKLGISMEKPEKKEKSENVHPKYPCYIGKRHNMQPNKNQLNIQYKPNPSPQVKPLKSNPNHPNKKQLKVNFAKTQYIDIPKESNTTKTEPKEENNDLELKMKTIDDWGKCLLLKTQELSNKLAEKFKDLPTLKISADICNTINNEEKKEEKEKKLKSNKSAKIISSFGLRPENVPKKINLCPTKPTVIEKEKKVKHLGVKCDQCGIKPIVGCRYKCSVCPNFDFCEECEKKYASEHNHAFFKITEPSMKNLISKNFLKK